jgi:hypothetical protein
MSQSITPETVVQQQLDAYNARDIDALIAIYDENAELYEHPSTLIASGAADLRERYSARFQEPNLYARLVHRIVVGNKVIDHEQVTRTFPEGTGTSELVMIYEVQNGKIVRAWMIPGAKTLDS